MNKKLLSIFLSLCMVLTLLPFSAIAEENDTYDYSGGEIISFEAPETTEQTFPTGTAIDDLHLPESLTATVRTAVTTSSVMVAEITIPVTWESTPEYDMDTTGEYVFTPVIEGYSVSAELPEISVTLEESILQEIMTLSTTAAVTLIVGVHASDDNVPRSDEATYKTLAGAYAAALPGDIIQFESDSEIISSIDIKKNITIDLNGNEITQNGTFKVFNAELTLKDSKTGGKLIKTSTSDSPCVTTYDKASFVLESGIIESSVSYVVNINYTSSKFEMTGGAIYSTSGTAIYISGTANISGGTISTDNGTALWNFGGKTTISGGNIQATGSGATISGWGYVYIADGSLLKNQRIKVSENSQFWLTGGSLENVTVTSESSDFNVNLNCFLAPGATFNQKDIDGTETTYSGTLTAKLADVAEVNGVQFGILQQAFDSAATGTTEEERTVELLQNIDMGKANIKVNSGDIILDFREYTINSSKSNASGESVISISGGNFTCKATTGGITSSGALPLAFSSSGNLTIYGGKFSGQRIYATYSSGNVGDITINNGEFDGLYVQNRKSLIINDGIFKTDISEAVYVSLTPVIINKGTFESKSPQTVYLWKSPATINGGDFSCIDPSKNVLYVLGNNACTINGGTFSSPIIQVYNIDSLALKLQGGNFTSGIAIYNKNNDSSSAPKSTLANILQNGYVYVDASGNRVSLDGYSYNNSLRVQKTYNITGTIKGSDTGSNGLSGANVQLKNGPSNAGSPVITDSIGGFTITGVQNGNYTIEVSKSGYATDTIPEFTVSEDVISKDLTLQKIYTALTSVSVSKSAPKVGDTLTATIVPSNATVSYQWKINNVEISGATTMSYTVQEGDVSKSITVTVTGSGEFDGSITSNPTAAVVKKAAPSAPGAPELSSKTHNSVTLSANGAYEFSKDGITWQEGNVFSGLAANTSYTFYQRVAETDDTEESPASSSLSVTTDVAPANELTGTASIDNTTPRIGDTLTASLVGGSNSGTLTYVWKAGGEQAGTGTSYTVTAADLGKTITLEITSSIETGKITSSDTAAVLKKSAPSAPGAPSLSSKTHNSITLSANAAYEFSKDGITWQAGNVFSGLIENTEYAFYQRVAETDDTEESPASSSLSVTTDVAPANELTGTASIDNTTPRIGDTLTASLVGGSNSGTLTYVWKAGGEQIGTGTSYTVTAADLGKAITLEITSSIETGKITSSDTAAVLKKSAPSAPGAPSLSSKTHNSITLSANGAYEFSKDGITWQKGNIFSGLAANKAYTFYQRVAETSEREASEEGSGLTVTTNSITGGGGSSGGGGGGGSTTPKPVAPAPVPQPPAAPVTPIFIEYPTISNMMIPNITPGVLEALNGFVVPESLVKGIELPEALNTISVEGRIPNFADTGNHWAGDTINKAVERGLLNGVSEREFAPKSNLTLEQTLVGFNNVFLKNNMIQMKVKREYLENRLNEYLKNESWSTLAVVQTLGNTDLETIEKIAQKPQVLKQTITRGELADYLLKLTGDILDAKDMTPEEFCKTYGFMVGDADGNFSAERVLKRAELAAILLRVDNELMSSDDREAGPDQQNRN